MPADPNLIARTEALLDKADDPACDENLDPEAFALLRALVERVRELEAERANYVATNRAFSRLRAVVLAALDGLQRRYDDLPEDEDDAAERMRAFVDALTRREETLINEVNAAFRQRDEARELLAEQQRAFAAAVEAMEARHDAAIAGIVDDMRAGAAQAAHDYEHSTTTEEVIENNHERNVLTRLADSIASTHAAALARHAARAADATLAEVPDAR